MTIKLVCGDCADRVVALGLGEIDRSVLEIASGHLCETHLSVVSRQAVTAVQLGSGDWSMFADRTASEPPPAPWTDVDAPNPSYSSNKRLIEVAAALVVAWSAGEKGANADGLLVDHAIAVAKLIVLKAGAQT